VPHLGNMQNIGTRYAESGLGFSAWFEAGRALRARLMPLLLDAYAGQPARLAAAVRGVAIFVDLAMVAVGGAYVTTKERIIGAQEEAIRELSTPVLELEPGLLILPAIGIIDSDRARGLTERLLYGIADRRAKTVVLDVTAAFWICARSSLTSGATLGRSSANSA